MFETFQDLNESSLIRSEKSLSSFTARDIADLIFLYFLALQILRSEFETAPFAKKYASKTLETGDINKLNLSGNDLFLLIHTLFGKDSKYFSKLKGSETNLLFKDTIYFDWQQAKRWLQGVANNTQTSSDSQFLLKLESMLQIKTSDYRSIRRLVGNWDELEQHERQFSITRLVYAFQSKASQSDVYKSLATFAQKDKLFIKDTINPEVQSNAPSTLKNIARGAAVGGAISTIMIGNAFKNLLFAANKQKKLKEEASMGSTTSGAIAVTPTVLGGEPIRRIKKNKKVHPINK